jgi:hypothetical protein
VFRFINKIPVLIIGIVLLAVLILMGKEPVQKNITLKKTVITDPMINRAIAYLDKGKLKVAVENYGIFCGKSQPEGLWGDFQYISDLSLMVGIPGKDAVGNPYPWAVGQKQVYSFHDQDFITLGNDETYWGPTVSENWFDRTYPNYNRTDWDAVDDAGIFLHNPQASAGEYYGALGLWTNSDDPYPLIATSDIPETWPLINDEHVWPGPWALDPADTTGETVLEGTFVSDQDIYFEFDDRLATRDIDPNQGYPIGIRSKVSAYSYSASISEDIIFFKMCLYNESDKYFNSEGYNYENVYAGFYFDVDSYNRLADGSYAGRTNDDDMMGYNTDYDFGYIYDLDGDSGPYSAGKELAYSAVKLLETPEATEEVDLDGDGYTDIYPGDKLGLTSWHWFDWYFRPGAKDGGLQGPFSGDGETPVQDNKEEIQYKIIACDTTNLLSYDSIHYFHPPRGEGGYGKINPRFDSVEGLLYEYPDGLDCVFIMGSGPFSIAPGDSVPFSFCIIMGQDEDDLVTNAKVAQLMYDNNYQGARAPKAPNVTVKEEDQKVTLYWDSAPVHDKDIITGYEDFEGFRIYKSTDLGKTWGEQMYDEESRTSYWKPIAQFDLINEFEGFEPLAPHRYLGENTDLEFKYVDTDVYNGTEYLYAVCAYDRGFIPFYSDSINGPLYDPLNVAESKALNFKIPSLENLLSNSTNLSHVVKAIPHRPASNTELKELRVEKIPGTIGTGVFDVEVVSPEEVKGHIYKVLFDCDYSDTLNTVIIERSQRYTIVDSTSGDTLIKDSKEYATDTSEPESPPVFDGMRWSIQMATTISPAKEDAYWKEGSKCTYRLATLNFIKANEKTRSDYEMRFIGEDAESVFRKDGVTEMFKVPFQVWNTATKTKTKIWTRKGTKFEQDPQVFNLYETELPEGTFQEEKQTLKFSFDWVEPDSIDPETNKVVPPDKKWEPGDIMVIPIRKPFERGDGFIVNTEEVFNIEKVTSKNISEVRVVPNPYIVDAAWETDDFVGKLQFTNLPDKCKIYIFTIAAEHVITLEHNSASDGSKNWDLLTKNRQEAAPGLYVYVVEAENGEKHRGKFVIIK